LWTHSNTNVFINYIHSAPGKTRAIISYEKYNRLQGKIDGGVCVGINKTSTSACSKSSTGPNKGESASVFFDFILVQVTLTQ
jgi:hypothetical protein